MANFSVFQSTFSCGAHNQAAFNSAPASCWIPSHGRKLSSSWHSQETNWGGPLAVTVPVQGSMNILVSYQVDSLALKTANSSHSAAWLTLGAKEQRNSDSFGIHDASKPGEGEGGRESICFLHFLVAQFLCSSIFTVLKARQFHLQ